MDMSLKAFKAEYAGAQKVQNRIEYRQSIPTEDSLKRLQEEYAVLCDERNRMHRRQVWKSTLDNLICRREMIVLRQEYLIKSCDALREQLEALSDTEPFVSSSVDMSAKDKNYLAVQKVQDLLDSVTLKEKEMKLCKKEEAVLSAKISQLQSLQSSSSTALQTEIGSASASAASSFVHMQAIFTALHELKKSKAAVKVRKKGLCAELDKCKNRLLVVESIVNDEFQLSGSSISDLSITDTLELQKRRLEQEDKALDSKLQSILGQKADLLKTWHSLSSARHQNQLQLAVSLRPALRASAELQYTDAESCNKLSELRKKIREHKTSINLKWKEVCRPNLRFMKIMNDAEAHSKQFLVMLCREQDKMQSLLAQMQCIRFDMKRGIGNFLLQPYRKYLTFLGWYARAVASSIQQSKRDACLFVSFLFKPEYDCDSPSASTLNSPSRIQIQSLDFLDNYTKKYTHQ